MGFLDTLFGPSKLTTRNTATYREEFQELAALLGRLSPGLVGRPQVPYLGRTQAPLSPMSQMAMGRAYEAGTASESPIWSPMARRPSGPPTPQPQQQAAPQQAMARGGLARARMYRGY